VRSAGAGHHTYSVKSLEPLLSHFLEYSLIFIGHQASRVVDWLRPREDISVSVPTSSNSSPTSPQTRPPSSETARISILDNPLARVLDSIACVVALYSFYSHSVLISRYTEDTDTSASFMPARELRQYAVWF
jgi:hypothetical protein